MKLVTGSGAQDGWLSIFLVFCFVKVNYSMGISENEASSQFRLVQKFSKLDGDNIYHMKFKSFNLEQNLEECAQMTLALDGKSFDFWMKDCYINSDDTSIYDYLSHSDRYSYYEKVGNYEKPPSVDPNPDGTICIFAKGKKCGPTTSFEPIVKSQCIMGNGQKECRADNLNDDVLYAPHLDLYAMDYNKIFEVNTVGGKRFTLDGFMMVSEDPGNTVKRREEARDWMSSILRNENGRLPMPPPHTDNRNVFIKGYQYKNTDYEEFELKGSAREKWIRESLDYLMSRIEGNQPPYVNGNGQTQNDFIVQSLSFLKENTEERQACCKNVKLPKIQKKGFNGDKNRPYSQSALGSESGQVSSQRLNSELSRLRVIDYIELFLVEPGQPKPGKCRYLISSTGHLYFTGDHYDTFSLYNPKTRTWSNAFREYEDWPQEMAETFINPMEDVANLDAAVIINLSPEVTKVLKSAKANSKIQKNYENFWIPYANNLLKEGYGTKYSKLAYITQKQN